jgi:hypothetical protein
MQGFAVVLAVIVGLSLSVAKAVDFTRNLPWFKDKAIGSWVWNALAFVYGLALCVGWQHSVVNDLFAQVPALANVNLGENAGYIISGLIVGGGAGFAHEVLDALSGIASASHATAAATMETTDTSDL